MTKKKPPIVQIQGNKFWNPQKKTDDCICWVCEARGEGAYKLPKLPNRGEGKNLKTWYDALTAIQKKLVVDRLKPLLDVVDAGLSMSDAELDEYLEGKETDNE